MKIVTAAQMRAIEEAFFASGRATVAELMGQAGRAAADAALGLLDDPGEVAALVLVGPGKNGGDGLVAAEALYKAGLRAVAVWLYHRDGVGETPVEAGLLDRVRVVGDGAPFARALADAGLIVDALFGIGQRDRLPDDLLAVLKRVDARLREPGVRGVAVDIPTGVNADTGAVAELAFRADATVTFGRSKRGLYLAPGLRYTGRVAVAPLGLGEEGVPDDAPRLITRADAAARLPRREADAHKGTAGSLLIVGGSANYLGAPVLSAGAALRVGAGLVTLAVPRSLVIPLAAQLPEATYLPLPEAGWGIAGPHAAQTIADALGRYTALQLGNGLGREPETEEFLARLFGVAPRGRNALGFGQAAAPPATNRAALTMPALLDADGLNWLSTVDRWWEALSGLRLVLTPHPGEMGRLRGVETHAITADPWTAARDAARAWGQTVVLKGGHTVVAAPDGALWVTPTVNPALAAAGTGDTLAGEIAGLLTQGLDPTDAALLGLWLGSRAADLASEELGVLPLVASDLPAYLGMAVQELEDE
ncbi:MAG TPA: NAD(P)H-hydrate dehydratase [Thermomicrobiales bacterium]|nr:NAD(P)H-hydrate dehydratase [Thermomicrobiales bacterium]